MNSPESRKEVQSLIGKLVALKRFLSKAAERSLPFFQTLKNSLKKSNFRWNEEAERAFFEMKSLLKELHALTAPIAGETLMLYLATSKEAISFVLVADRGQVLYKPDVSGRLGKWAIELGEHEINYSPFTVVKGHTLADYLAEITGEVWELYTDGACGPEGTGARLVLMSPDGQEQTYALKFMFAATNNESEYEALLSRLCIAQQLRIKHLDAYVDSQLVANQVNGSFGAHEASMQRYMELLHELANEFDVFRLTQMKKSAKDSHESPMYALIEGVLYRKSYLGPSLLFIRPNQAKEVLRKVHEGSCALHSGYRTIATKYALISRALHHPMIPITAAWPFSKWAIDIVGPITACSGGIKFLVVAIDYFTKWVEAKALATITSRRIRNFFWKDIVCRIGDYVWRNNEESRAENTGKLGTNLEGPYEAAIPGIDHPTS
ncbi:uncharacterized protein [Rutidosis leptorrhynchoides]|uniref:uncharacterized protein n=1 Tax=Rutidosis leptorrhynchoides TaxID=125765 RepID=UPI003A9997D8